MSNKTKEYQKQYYKNYYIEQKLNKREFCETCREFISGYNCYKHNRSKKHNKNLEVIRLCEETNKTREEIIDRMNKLKKLDNLKKKLFPDEEPNPIIVTF